MKLLVISFVAIAASAFGSSVLEQLSASSQPGDTRISERDFVRAKTLRPHEFSHVHGKTTKSAFYAMNKHLKHSEPVKTAPCASFSHAELNEVSRVIFKLRTPELQDMYAGVRDKRSLHFTDISYKEELWASETPTNVTRDGKCAETIMWYIHHLSQRQRDRLASIDHFVLPLMPEDVASIEAREAEFDGGNEYNRQISCTDCHVPVRLSDNTDNNSALPSGGNEKPIVPGPQFVPNCPVDNATGLPKVWYEPVESTKVGERFKRCDWDYDPPCQPCEGIGGKIWGGGEDEWEKMQCTVVATPDEIDPANITNPIWPKTFTVEEYADLTFPGTDPCDVDFKHSTYTLLFDTREDENDYYYGPLYHTVGHTGPSGPSPVPGSSWAVGNGNFWNSVDVNEEPSFCVCLAGPRDIGPTGVKERVVTGALAYDFAKNSVLVGREIIVPEYLEPAIEVLADHWMKGPHHFWIDVNSNQMIRGWQPFNGLDIYYDWSFEKPLPEKIEVPQVCYEGLRASNISCLAPAPP